MHQQEQSETKLIAVRICHHLQFSFSIHTTLVVIHIVCVCVCVGRVMLEHSKAALVIAVSALDRTGSGPGLFLSVCWAGCESKCSDDHSVFECIVKYVNHSRCLIYLRHLNWPWGNGNKSSTSCIYKVFKLSSTS